MCEVSLSITQNGPETMITCVLYYSQRDNTLHIVLCRTTIYTTHVMHVNYVYMSPVCGRPTEYTVYHARI